MAHFTGRRFQGQARSVRRKTSWSNGPGQTAPQTVINGTSSNLANLGFTALSDGLTIVRVRGELMLWLSSAAASLDGFAGALGIGIVNTQAFLAGAASVPMPITEMDWEGWMYHRIIQLKSGGAIASSASTEQDETNAVTAALRLVIDTKAMRKISGEETIFAALEVFEVGTAVLNWSINSRMLSKLP